MKKKKKNGRPSKIIGMDYGRLLRLCASGMTDEQLAVVYNVAGSTIRRWKDSKQFRATLEANKELADKTVVNSLYKRANGFYYDEVTYKNIWIGQGRGKKPTKAVEEKRVTKFFPPDPLSMQFWLTNRQRTQWKHRHEIGGIPDMPLGIKILDHISGKEKSK